MEVLEPFRPTALLARQERLSYFRRKAPEGPVVEFEALYESCFEVPLDTGRDVGPRRYEQPGGFGAPDGLCPLCNNSAHALIDAALMAPGGVARVVREHGFNRPAVVRHLVRHVGPIYSQVGALVFGLASRMLEESGLLDIQRPSRKDDKRALAELESEIGAVRERVDDSPAHRLYSVRYAYRGGARVVNADGNARSLVPFSRGQVAGETERRAIDAINFYDEMMDIRARAITIYDRIMDPDDLITDAGQRVKQHPNPKYYRTALAAVSEMRGVVETLGKMSLIAKRLNEGSEGPRRLSPDLQSIIDQIRSGAPKAASPAPSPEGDGAEAPADDAIIEAFDDGEEEDGAEGPEDDGLGDVKRAIMADAEEREDRASVAGMRDVTGGA